MTAAGIFIAVVLLATALVVACVALLALLATVVIVCALARLLWHSVRPPRDETAANVYAARLIAESEAHGVALVNTALAESTGPVVPVQRTGRDMLN